MARIQYGGPIVEHWSWAWARGLCTAPGLGAMAAVFGIIILYQVSIGREWVNIVVSLGLVALSGVIAWHLHRREQDQGLTEPDASMRMLFNVGCRTVWFRGQHRGRRCPVRPVWTRGRQSWALGTHVLLGLRPDHLPEAATAGESILGCHGPRWTGIIAWSKTWYMSDRSAPKVLCLLG